MEQIRESLNRPLANESTTQLVGQFLQQSTELVKKEIELARAEIRDDLTRELKAARKLGIASVCALSTLNLLLVAVVFALPGVSGVVGSLIVAASVLVIGAVAALLGWKSRVTAPLEKTQKTLKGDLRWAKERMS